MDTTLFSLAEGKLFDADACPKLDSEHSVPPRQCEGLPGHDGPCYWTKRNGEPRQFIPRPEEASR